MHGEHSIFPLGTENQTIEEIAQEYFERFTIVIDLEVFNPTNPSYCAI